MQIPKTESSKLYICRSCSDQYTVDKIKQFSNEEGSLVWVNDKVMPKIMNDLTEIEKKE